MSCPLNFRAPCARRHEKLKRKSCTAPRRSQKIFQRRTLKRDSLRTVLSTRARTWLNQTPVEREFDGGQRKRTAKERGNLRTARQNHLARSSERKNGGGDSGRARTGLTVEAWLATTAKWMSRYDTILVPLIILGGGEKDWRTARGTKEQNPDQTDPWMPKTAGRKKKNLTSSPHYTIQGNMS